MRLPVERDGMDAQFLKVSGDVALSRSTAMACQTILLRQNAFQEMFCGTGLMIGVTVIARKRGNRGRPRRHRGGFQTDIRRLVQNRLGNERR